MDSYSISFCNWYILCSIMSSEFIHSVTGIKICFFLRLNDIPLHVYVISYIFIHLSVDTWVVSPIGSCENSYFLFFSFFCFVFDSGHPNGHEMLPHCGFASLCFSSIFSRISYLENSVWKYRKMENLKVCSPSK